MMSRALLAAIESVYEREDAELGDFTQTPDFRHSRAVRSANLRDMNFRDDENNQDYLAQMKGGFYELKFS